MLERNPDARCETCPYFADMVFPEGLGACHRYPVEAFKLSVQWCGEHPEFLREAVGPVEEDGGLDEGPDLRDGPLLVDRVEEIPHEPS